MHYAWANEMGFELRPDMIFNTLLSQFAKNILDSPSDYKHLFGSTSDGEKREKREIMIVGGFDIEKLVKAIRNKFGNFDFASVICDTKFDSDAENADYARKMIFACMGTPYFNYMMTMCGIPHIEVIGSQADWEKLLKATKSLLSYDKNSSKSAITVIENIIYYCFGNKSDTFVQMMKTKEDFFSDIFHYGKNKKCGSGHDKQIVSGSKKYMKMYDFYIFFIFLFCSFVFH
jgi:hypothetical protein